ncbi:MAG: DUF2283 domain-containing protein [Dehalococcoidia bacterium]|nr:DUF2283 domain-containing protein [Dehalococcoidia bacterium]
MPKISYSPDVDALLIELSDKPIDHAKEIDSAIVHYTLDGEPVLLEILDAKRCVLNILENVLTPRTPAI